MTTVYFSISNAANQPLTGSKNQYSTPNYVTLAPTSYPINNNESILDADVSTYVPDSNGMFSASLYPQFYKGYIKGTNTHTHFILNVPTGSAINAADNLVVLSSSVINPGKYAYSMAASDARYVQGTSGTASFATSASWAPFINNPNAISASWASSSLSSSYAITSSYDLNSSRLPISLSYSSTMSLANTNDVNIYRIQATGDLFLDTPTGTKDGSNIEVWVYGTNISMSINPSFKVPTNSSYTNPYIISGSNAKVKVLLQYDGFKTQWELTSLIGNY